MDNGLSDEPRRIRNQAQYFISIGRYERARSIISELISKYPEYPYAYYDMAVCEYYLGRIDNSIELCYKSLELGMRQVAVSIILMMLYNEKCDFAKVDNQYEVIKSLDPTNNDALAIYGYSLSQRGNEKEGIPLLEEAFKNDATNSIIIGYLFFATKKSRNKAQKEELLKLYMNSGASEKRKLLFAGKYNIHMKKWKNAKECFARVIGMDPMNEEAIHYMKIIELKENLPKLIVMAAGWTVAIYITRFNCHELRTYGFFMPALMIFLLVAVLIYKLRRL